jgi:hypothetical protein
MRIDLSVVATSLFFNKRSTGESRALKGEGKIGSIDDRRLDLNLVSRGRGEIGRDRLHPDSGAGLDDPGQLFLFKPDPIRLLEFRQLGINGQKAGDRLAGLSRVKSAEAIGQEKTCFPAAGNPIPGDIDSLEKILRGRVA